MAGTNVGTAYLEIVPSAQGFSGKLQSQLGGEMATAGSKAGDSAGKGFATRFTSGVKVAALAGAAALGGAVALGIGFVKDSIGEARESQKVGAITEQIIKSTGGAAKVTASQVGDLATAISNKTGVDDEAIQSGANLLLTFKNVRNETGKGADIFDRATAAAADLSAAGFGDMAGTSKQLGKALNDPIKGISALSRSGVTFTEQQKKQIKTLVASGKTLEAQKIILGEVESQVGGVAEKSATAGEKLATAWGNFKEGIGTSLLPVIDKGADALRKRLLPGIQGVIDILVKGDFTSSFRKAFNLEEDSKVVGFLFGVRDTFKEIVGGVRAFGAAWKANDGDITSSGFAGFMETLANAGHKAFDFLKGAIPPIIASAKKLWPPIKEIATQLLAASQAGGVSTFGLLKAVLAALPGILESVAPLLESVAKWMGENKDIVAALVVALGAGIAAFKVISTIAKVYTGIQAALNVVLAANPIGLIVIAIAALAAGLIYAYKNSETFRNVVDAAFKAIAAVARWLWNTIFVPFLKFLITGFSTLVGWVAGLLDALGNIPGFGWAKDAAAKLRTAAQKAQEFGDNIKEIPDEKTVTISLRVNTAVSQAASGLFASIGGLAKASFRASGGPVVAGRPYIVGENEPELFVPNTSGRIYNQAQQAGMNGGSGQMDLSDRTLIRFAQLLRELPNPVVTPATVGRAVTMERSR